VNLIAKGSQVAVTVALATFLSPDELGLATVAVSLVNIGQVIQSMGVYDVVAKTRLEIRVMSGTLLTMSVSIGVVLAAVGVLCADWISAAIGAPDAASVVKVAALSLPFSAAGGVQMGIMHRDLDFRKRLIPDAGSAVAGAIVTIVLAVARFGPYSLAIGLLVIAVLQPVLGLLVGVRIPLRWDRAAATEAMRWVSVVGPGAAVAILLTTVHYPIVGRALGAASVGLYSLAFRIAWTPYIMVAVVLGAVAFPVYTRLSREGRGAEIPEAVEQFFRAVLLIVGGIYAVTAVLAYRIVVLGERWGPAAPILVVLCGYGLGICLLQTL